MCGIFGHAGNISKEKVIQCTDTLIHRGPDDWGVFHTISISFGHRRLSILDLSDRGRQPMSYAGVLYWIPFNGEIYNLLELGRELESKGHRFKSDTDTEVILAAFSQWSEKCLNRFNGSRAFAIWDEKKKTLFLCSDRFSKKSLFHAYLTSGFVFASEMKALFPLLDQTKPNVGF